MTVSLFDEIAMLWDHMTDQDFEEMDGDEYSRTMGHRAGIDEAIGLLNRTVGRIEKLMDETWREWLSDDGEKNGRSGDYYEGMDDAFRQVLEILKKRKS